MPDVGELTPAQVWAAATRTLTDISAEEIFDLPALDDIYGNIGVSSGAGDGLFGSWVQISANIGTGKRLIYVHVSARSLVDSSFELEFGEGGSGSEAMVAQVEGIFSGASEVGAYTQVPLPIWKSLTDSARLSARVKDTHSGAKDYRIAVGVA